MATATTDTPATQTGGEVEGVQQRQGQSVACPDPSLHEKHDSATKLQEQASKAALYVTHPEKNSSGAREMSALGPDGKLSSAGAATSIKYARNNDLPGFPSTGGLDAAHSHSAANLAHDNQKPFEHWKPDSSHSAGKAAMLAHDNQKPFEHWKPDLSSAGSKAAVLAHKNDTKVNVWTPEASKHGNSAANIAMGKKGLAPQVDYGHTEDGRKKALIAATGAAKTGRERANSSPARRPGKPSPRVGTTTGMRSPELVDANRWDSDAMQAARIQHAQTNRAMYTEHPPVEIEREEAQHQAALKASAVSMAKKMYELQQSHIEEAAGFGAARAHERSGSAPLTQDNLKTAAMQHLTLQEAAQRLAEERLAKMKTDDATAFRDYYGYGSSPPRSPRQIRNKLSIRGRKRANSEGAESEQPQSDRWVDSDDEEQSRRIKKQMSQLRNQVQDVDVKKRQKDRAALIAAAEKKVQAQMHNLDEKVFNDTGKMSPAMIEDWENKARVRVEKQREEEALEKQKSGEGGKPGEKVHIGAGKYMTQVEIEEIARKRVQPTLLEIGEQAEKQRAKDREAVLDKEETKRQARVEKEKEHEKKEEDKKTKADEKHAAKAEKEAEKVKRREEKRMAKEEKQRSKNIAQPTEADADAPDEPAGEASAGGLATDEKAEEPAFTLAPPPAPPITSTEPETHVVETPAETAATETPVPPPHGMSAVEPTATATTTATAEEAKPKTSDDTKKSSVTSPTSPPTSPTREGKGIKGFFSKFRRKSKAAPGEIKSFAGGHRLSKAKQEQEVQEKDKDKEEDKADVGAAAAGGATAATAEAGNEHAEATRSRSPSISSLSSSDYEGRDEAPTSPPEEEDTAERGRQRLAPLNTDGTGAGHAKEDTQLSAMHTNTTTGTAATEEFEEARDQFDETLSPPQPAFTSKKGENGSPHRDSKFFENV